MELDKIITGDSAVVLQSFESDCIDLTVTSPPYDNLRTYNGFTFDFETIACELFRVTKAGGVVVWVVGDATVKGSESLKSFRQALFFKECGFNVETMIYHKNNPVPNEQAKRYQPSFEYMFIFSKGQPKTFNPIKVEATKFGKVEPKRFKVGQRKVNGESKPFHGKHNSNKMKLHHNIFSYNIGFGSVTSDKIAFQHPAIFPEALAYDHIVSWSNEGDTVLDCFCGSGTTPKMAKLLNRHYIGIDTSAEYAALANERLAQLERGLTLPAPDGGDSASSQSLSTPDMFSAIEHEPTPAPRR